MDGRSIIHCKGLKRFRMTQKWDQDGYLVGRVECFNDDPIKVPIIFFLSFPFTNPAM